MPRSRPGRGLAALRRHATPMIRGNAFTVMCDSIVATWGVFAQTETCDVSPIVRLAYHSSQHATAQGLQKWSSVNTLEAP